MNKIITKTVTIRGKEVNVEDLPDKSNIYVVIECKHGQRKTKWQRRHNKCIECLKEAGTFNTSKKGRVITWGDKISAAKKGKTFTDEHKKALVLSRAKKLCDNQGISLDEFEGFPTAAEQLQLRKFAMSAIKRNIINKTVEEQDILIKDGLSFSIKDLKEHLEKQFYTDPRTGQEMTWDNYGEWHIDHIIPDSWFNYTTTECEDFKKCWSLENLQPMWAWQNIQKGNRYKGKYRPRHIRILAGQFGVGKTTMCKELEDKFTIIDYDKTNIKELKKTVSSSYFNDRPVLISTPVHISTIHNTLIKQGYTVDIYMIIEDIPTVVERLQKRSAKINMPNIEKRFKRMVSISQTLAYFSGTYEEVFKKLCSLET